MESPVHVFESMLSEYFHERLLEFGETMSPKPKEDTLWYMCGVLSRLGDSSQLFSYEEGNIGLRPLAMLYKDAFEAREKWERCLILRQLGDLSLFLGAVFPERYARRGIHRDYFVGMGGGAYDYLAENAHQNRHVFSELAAMFARLLELVARACSKQNPFDASDVLELYQRWRQTGDPLAARQLRTLGISLPVDEQMQ